MHPIDSQYSVDNVVILLEFCIYLKSNISSVSTFICWAGAINLTNKLSGSCFQK